jgi:hypothetical protein
VNINRAEAIERLCELVSEVGGEVFSHQHSHDCICDEGMRFVNVVIAEPVIAFIEKAVRDAIAARPRSRQQFEMFARFPEEG